MHANTNRTSGLLLALITAASLAACAPADDADETPASDDAAEAVEEPMADTDDMEGDMDHGDAGMAEASALSGTSWQLVAIRSMDDTETVPDDGSKYTLTFTEDGSVQVRSDCNRGMGSYTSAGPSQVEFGPIALTRRACLDASIATQYEQQFQYVRSYVLENGHLFLATMADGAIIEFAPMEATAE